MTDIFARMMAPRIAVATWAATREGAGGGCGTADAHTHTGNSELQQHCMLVTFLAAACWGCQPPEKGVFFMPLLLLLLLFLLLLRVCGGLGAAHLLCALDTQTDVTVAVTHNNKGLQAHSTAQHSTARSRAGKQ